MIEYIELDHFKKHDHLEAQFQPGLNALTAPNAAGKTTLLKAIAYALMGTTATGSKAAHLTQWGESSHKVTLRLKLNGEEHTVSRTPKSSSVMTQGRMVASGTSATSQYIEDALGLSSRDLLMLAVSSQGETQALLEMGAAGLQKRVEDIARVGLIDQVLSLIATDQTKLDAIASLLPGLSELEQQYQEKQGSVSELEDRIALISQGVTNANIQLLSAQQQLKDETAVYTEASRQHALADILRRQSHDNNLKIQEAMQAYKEVITHKIPEPGSSSDLDAKLDERVRQLVQAREQQTERQGLVRMLETLDGKLQVSRVALEKSNQAAEQMKNTTSLLDASRRDYEVAKVDYKLACEQHTAAQQTVANAICHACQRPFSEKELQAAQRRAEEARADRDNKSAYFASVAETFNTLNSKMDDLTKVYDPRLYARHQQDTEQRDMYAAMLSAKPDVSAVIQQINDDVDTLRGLRQQLQAEEEIYRRWEDRRAYTFSHLTTLENHQKSIQTELDTCLKTLPNISMDELKSSLQAADFTVKSVQANLSNMSGRHAELKMEHNSVTAQIDQHQKDLIRLKEAEAQRTRLTQLGNFLRKNRSRWMTETWENLLLQATYLLETVTEGKLSTLKRTDSGDFSLIEEGREVPVTELSGAQRSMVGLCLRVALSQTFYSGNLFLLLDEPCADMSEDNAARIAGMLQGLTGTQIIMVSHRQSGVMNAGHVIAL